ncbi:MAG: ribosome-associated translation inhibitor RaiA [Gammaproteobacteria bacterium]|nr:ribosome-associated translation inhibitor RaiA [Gammaproteobacteria bacterium]
MNITILGHHIEVTEALRDYVTQKVERISGHYDKINKVNVTLSVEKYNQKAEATLHVTGNDIHADSTKDDMYAAIDDMVDKLDRQVRHYKRKITDHRM